MKIKTDHKTKTYRIKILGIVQGVGFRPFIFNLASGYGLDGYVANTGEGVILEVNSNKKKELDKFIGDIRLKKPGPALIEDLEVSEIAFKGFNGFRIRESRDNKKFQLISPDLATCSDCLFDISNKDDKRRYEYPFTNCTNCGPRFTIMEKLPYDRPDTTMRDFKLCSHCSREYSDQNDRRFHAQPVACRACGPRVWLADRNGRPIEEKDPIKVAVQKLKQGSIVAIKGLGGYQLACDATNSQAVKELRARKRRPSKPFAIMVKNLARIGEHYFLGEAEKRILSSPRAPILLLSKKSSDHIAEEISYYNRMEGVMLPYTPLHHLIFKYLDIPLVMTSGNRSEEPIAKDNDEAVEKLKNISDYFLMHDRGIYSRYDDSLAKVFDGKEMLLRRARGYSPYPVKIAEDIGDRQLLALGAQEKNTFCLLKKNYAIISQHLGDLDDADSLDFFEETLGAYKRMFNIGNIRLAAHDGHPLYETTRYAQRMPYRKVPYQHHHCHIASVVAENKIEGKVLGFAWDGTGYGLDKKIWGSEIFIYEQGSFKRLGHLTEKEIPGGEISIKKPYRMAISYLYRIHRFLKSEEIFSDFVLENLKHFKKIISPQEIQAIEAQINTGFNSPLTTSMGRLFDAVSSAAGLTQEASYEGEAAVHLESVANRRCSLAYSIAMDGFLIDDIDLFRQVTEDIKNGVTPDTISSKFHNYLASVILEICKKSGIRNVALSGGVFQNHLLLDKAFRLLKENNFKAYTNFKVPVNDGGISLGQAYLAALKFRKES